MVYNRYNTGLNYIYGMLSVICGEESNEVFERLEDAFTQIENGEKTAEFFEDIFDKTLILASYAKKSSINAFSEFINNKYQERCYEVYDKLQDNYSLNLVLNNYNQRINKIKGVLK